MPVPTQITFFKQHIPLFNYKTNKKELKKGWGPGACGLRCIERETNKDRTKYSNKVNDKIIKGPTI